MRVILSGHDSVFLVAALPRCVVASLLQRAARAQAAKARTHRILTPPPERRIHPAAPAPLSRLPDESGIPPFLILHSAFFLLHSPRPAPTRTPRSANPAAPLERR
jgi:hypothetical protein